MTYLALIALLAAHVRFFGLPVGLWNTIFVICLAYIGYLLVRELRKKEDPHAPTVRAVVNEVNGQPGETFTASFYGRSQAPAHTPTSTSDIQTFPRNRRLEGR